MTPSNPTGTDRRDALRDRFRALLAEAREAGVLAELVPSLHELLESARAAAARSSDADEGEAPELPRGPIPRRFGMVGDSAKMQRLFDLIERVAKSDVPVLVHGETGTGKELVAHALHDAGTRANKPFLAENCAAVSPTLLESELFGHMKGAFTGAVVDRPGHFVAADGGTVFLDEIGDMPLAMQSKLLRVLQEGEVRPVGSNKTITVDVRVVGASNKDLRKMVAERTFREDLYFRLNVVTLELPPLRERDGDVGWLLRFFFERVAKELHMEQVPPLEPEALRALLRWRWPGNVRELENEVRRVLALSRGPIGPSDLSPAIGAGL